MLAWKHTFGVWVKKQNSRTARNLPYVSLPSFHIHRIPSCLFTSFNFLLLFNSALARSIRKKKRSKKHSWLLTLLLFCLIFSLLLRFISGWVACLDVCDGLRSVHKKANVSNVNALSTLNDFFSYSLSDYSTHFLLKWREFSRNRNAFWDVEKKEESTTMMKK